MNIKYWIIVVSLVLQGCTYALVSQLTPNGGGSSGLTSLLVLLGLNRPSGGSSGYSISSAFSYTSNPNGVWSYGWKSTATGTFVIYDSKWDSGFSRSWYYSSYGSFPNFSNNYASSGGVSPGETNMHPGSSGQISVLRWTAPQAGTISIKGSFKAGDTGAVDVYVLKNTTTLFSKTSTLITESYDQTTTVAIGDTVDFQVGYAGNYTSDATPIDGVITYTSTTDSQVCTVSTLAGSGSSGSTDGTGTAASFNNPYGVAVDSSGVVYVADSNNNKIRKITASGVVTTFAGSGSNGSIDATGTAASFNQPIGIVVDINGLVYVGDRFNNKIRKITSLGVVTTLAGSGSQGSTDATGTSASFNNPYGVAVDSSGTVYVADTNNNKIRKITSLGVVTTFAGSGSNGAIDATGITASFNFPSGVAVDINGNVYVADNGNHKIRRVTSSGVVTTLAGSGSQGSTDGTGTLASFTYPFGVAVDSNGLVYVAGYENPKIRKITSSGAVTTLAGLGSQGSTDGTGTSASFTYPSGVVVDNSGIVYVADSLGNKIRKIVCQ